MSKNNLIVAHPNLQDPNFIRSVVFIVEQNKDGAFGLILNRREKDISLKMVFSGLSEKASHIPVYYGGPVQPDMAFVLHKMEQDPDAGFPIMDDIYMGSSIALIERLVENEEEMVFIHGYAGWGKGQLENEMVRKSWITVPARKKDFPFEGFKDGTHCWRKTMGRRGGLYRYYSRFVKDPLLN